jgi:eukaryotic-like serine/threonine-protein kinase
VYDPQGDGDPDHPEDVPLVFDGDPATSWSTYEYRGSPAFGNLKDGVGLVLDLGSAQELGGVTLASDTPGATVEIRTGDAPDGDIDDFDVAASGTLEEQTELAFDEPVSARYVLVWVTGLISSGDGFAAEVAEVTVQAAA